MVDKNSIPEFPAPRDGVLNAEIRSAFEDAGVVILRQFVDPAACAMLKKRANRLVDEFEPEGAGSVFSTVSHQQQSDDYFIGSGGAIRFFFEEGAFDEKGMLRQEKAHSINKLGHAMHDLDPVFEQFSRTPELKALVESLGFVDPRIVQSMYIFKPPGIGGEVVCHQDSTYLYTDPESCIGLWFAIDEATPENGCLQFIPGAQDGPLRKLNRRKSSGGLETVTLDETPFPDRQTVLAPADIGDVAIFHGRAPHMSDANRSTQSRHAYTLHIVDGAAKWPDDNWLQRPPSFPFRGFD